ncbi:lipoprotein-releasing system permease protein [Wenyingzhuangia heitensis]|uniref:Lipoprotein-releasing system permease protein n=1 Tax=Wenyingzhuangia heitensis TaxID=1487859 RepID=A0ABX0UAB0_9FLAO|nr:ABC transporter permease [Wenyingzhuangia heitensis]NIJ44411.1 lipoprotein-releasing system permease protein [Wenyingzhuangia heitensis]
MRFPLYIAQRYLKSKSGNNIINIVTILACMGVIAGTMALFIVLSVFSGIKDYSLSILDTNTPDIRITPNQGKSFLVDTNFINTLANSPDSITYTKVLEERAFFKNKDKEAIAFIKGVDSLFNKVTPVDSSIMVGEWFSNNSTNSCVAGFRLTRELDLNVYTDRLLTYVPKAGKGYITDPKNAFKNINPQVIGVISNQNQEDNKYVYVPISLSQELLNKQANEVSYIDIKVHAKNSKNTLNYLKNKLTNYSVSKREELNSSFYKILNSEKLIAYLVSLLVVVMVLSNTSGTIIMVIVDKKKDIKTLVNMGAPLKKVRRIFAIYGFLLNLAGMFIGLIFGIGLVFLQLNFELIMITPSIAYPIAFEWQNVTVVCCTIVIFGALASLLASGRISDKFIKRR